MNNQRLSIFIHSLHRSSSTYIFDVFRRSDSGYWCYQEPFNESLRFLDIDTERLLAAGRDVSRELKHPDIGKPYYWEYVQIGKALSGLFQESFGYNEFFVSEAKLPLATAKYLAVLIDNAKGRPVLQFCRSAGRIAAIKHTFGGTHIHLWREPRDQWWSYKIRPYFDATVHLIFSAAGLPNVLEEIRKQCHIVKINNPGIDEEFRQARYHLLRSEFNYFAFYGIWLFAFLEGEKNCDITISIDRLGNDQSYRNETTDTLKGLAIDGLDFSGCRVSRAVYSEEECAFFSSIEDRVHGIFANHGYAEAELQHAIAARKQLIVDSGRRVVNINEEAASARAIALGFLDEIAEVYLNEIIQLHNSLSWRITKPLRTLKSFFIRKTGPT